MADSIIEKLALVFLTEVEHTSTISGTNTTLSDVVRETRLAFNPRHLLAVIRQDYGEEAETLASNPAIVILPVTFIVSVYCTTSDRDQTAIDRILNHAWADVTKAVTEDWNVKTADTIGGLAEEWTVLAPEIYQAEDYDVVNCRYQAKVRVSENDPYTQR